MCNYLIKTVKSTQNQAKVYQHPWNEQVDREAGCLSGKLGKCGDSRARKWSNMPDLSSSISWVADADDGMGMGMGMEMMMACHSRRCRLVTQFVMQTGRVNRERQPHSTPTHVRGKERRMESLHLMRNENKLKSNFRITSSLAFQCKFNQQQEGHAGAP